jgi:NitT/TauT family transport system substrate-binding protein
MPPKRPTSLDRRTFLLGLTAAGTATLLSDARALAAQPPPETTRIRLTQRPNLCEAPNYVAEPLLRGEGFTEIQYVKRPLGLAEDAPGAGEVDITMLFGAPMVLRIDAGEPIVFLAGIHAGCVEVFAREHIRSLRDLKGKKVGVPALRGTGHILLATMGAHVGLNPERDIVWAVHPGPLLPDLLAEGRIDALAAPPPHAQAIRARRIGHVILNTLTDRPWSQYFCCMVVANTEFVRRHPVATKRALRAILKASELCAREPESVAQQVVDKGYVPRSAYTLQSLKEVAYGTWRQFNAHDTVRFYALRLHEAGLIKSSPQKILAEGTDWRFLDDLKRELKS